MNVNVGRKSRNKGNRLRSKSTVSGCSRLSALSLFGRKSTLTLVGKHCGQDVIVQMRDCGTRAAVILSRTARRHVCISSSNISNSCWFTLIYLNRQPRSTRFAVLP